MDPNQNQTSAFIHPTRPLPQPAYLAPYCNSRFPAKEQKSWLEAVQEKWWLSADEKGLTSRLGIEQWGPPCVFHTQTNEHDSPDTLLTEGHARHRRGIKYQPCQNHQNQLLVKLAPSTPLQQQQQTCFYRSSLHFCITLHALGHCKTLEREQHMWCGVTWFFAIKGPLNASWIQNRRMTLFFHSCVQRNRTARMNGSWKQLLIVCALVCAGKKNKTERNGCSGKCVQHGLSVLQEGELGKCEAVMMCCVVHSSRSAFLVSPGWLFHLYISDSTRTMQMFPLA